MRIPGDYDPSILADLKPAVARLQIPTYNTEGTGFLVAPDAVLTCHHVVDRLKVGGEVVCRFGDAGVEHVAHLERSDAASDVALLRLQQPVEGVAPLKLAPDAQLFTSWVGFGFPAFTVGVGVPLVGTLIDPDKRDRDGRAAVQVSADMLTGEDVPLGGLSGTPILHGRLVVGMIYSVLGAKTEWKATHFGLLYAVPSRALRALFDDRPVPKPPEAKHDDESRHPELAHLLRKLRGAGNSGEVLATIEQLRKAELLTTPVLLQGAEILLDMGAAHAVLGLLEGQREDRAQQLLGLALSLLGKNAEALAVLGGLPPSAETGGITGGISKRRYLETKNQNHLLAAQVQYESTYTETHDPYPGINVAILSLWLGNPQRSRKVAQEVLDIVTLKAERERDHWDWAMLGSAHLLLKNLEEAETCYRRAVAKNPDGARIVATMRTDARLCLVHLGWKGDELDGVLQVGAVACVTGHRVDADGAAARFPTKNVPAVTRALKAKIATRQIRFGFASAASGADLLFAETLLEAGGEATIFLPFPAEDFVTTSVGEGWRSRFRGVLDRVEPGRVVVLLDETPATDAGKNEAYARCNEAMQQAAADTARMFGERPLLVAVVVPASGAVPRGGTADAIRLWTERDRGEVIEIDPLAPPS